MVNDLDELLLGSKEKPTAAASRRKKG